MSEKINEIVNREVTKELDRMKSDPDYKRERQNQEDDGNESDEFLIQTTDVLAVTQSMIKDLKVFNNDFAEENDTNAYMQMARIEENDPNSNGFEMIMALDNAKVMFRFDQITERSAALYQKIFDLVESETQDNDIEAHPNHPSNSKHEEDEDEYEEKNNLPQRKPQDQRLDNNKPYERKLPPNVEEMLRQKRQQLANQLAYQQ